MEEKCSNCNGSGVIQEYDEFDRYHVLECSQCNGSGVINTEELKPCPSCRCEASIEESVSFQIPLYFVACKDCGIRTGYFSEKQEAIEAWNRRVNE